METIQQRNGLWKVVSPLINAHIQGQLAIGQEYYRKDS